MFRFGDLNRVIWPVRIGDAEFRAAFTIYGRKDLQERQARSVQAFALRMATEGAPKSADDIAKLLETTFQQQDGDAEDLLARVTDWFDVEDPDGKPLAFTRERLQAFLDTGYGFRAFYAALMEASREGPAKNSQPGPGGMPERDQA